MRKPVLVKVTSCLALLLGSAVAGRAQAATPSPSDVPRFTAGADAVALDLVVRDKKGRLVTDLQPGEVEVLEDGVPQKITSFRALEASSAAAGTPAAKPGGGDSAAVGAGGDAGAPRAKGRVMLVFGRLSSDGRRLAQGAGEEFAKKYVGPGVAASVVRIDGGLIPVLDETSDPAAVREGVRKATATIVGGPGRAGGPTGAENTYAGQNMSRLDGGAGARDLSLADSVAFVSALVKVVDALKDSPGRKTVILFSEGFVVPAGYEHVFSDVQSRANRANVSFYGMDVRGLSLSSQLGSSGAALATAAAISDQQRSSGSGAAATRDQMTQDDVVQTSMRSDVLETLSQLSTSTGGFLVTQTNDFGRPLARVAEDLRGYYEAAYLPSTPVAPGQFRRIEVRLARKDVRVQSRSGYFTTPPQPAVSFDVLAGAQLPSEIELRSRFYRFGREKGASAFDCLVKLEASLANAGFKPDAQGKLAGRLALVGRVLNAGGEVVETFGQNISLGGSEEQVQAARQQMVPMARRLRLPAGNYVVELVVRDPVGEKTTAQRLRVTVPSAEGDLAMSSLVIVARVDPAAARADDGDPLRLGDQRIVPNLGAAVAPAPGAMLPVFYNVYVKPGSKGTATATVEVSREGKVVARGSSPLPAADRTGRISSLSPIPLQKLAPGTYTVKVSVTNGAQTAEEATTVTVGS